MPTVELIMPKMGESIMEATILNWLKNEGDAIEVDEEVLEIATDKVDSEIPSPHKGVLVKKLHEVGDVVAVGKPVAIIETDAEVPSSSPSAPPVKEEPPAVEERPAAKIERTVETAKVAASPSMSSNGHSDNGDGRFYSPLVLNIARKEGISMSELENLPGTGSGGRVSKKDILAYLSERSSGGVSTQKAAPSPSIPQPRKAVSSSPSTTVTQDGNTEIVEMDRMRKLIAKHMIESKHTSAHVTSFVEADVTNLVLWRNKVKNEFQKKYGEKLTYTPLFIEALVKTIQDFPNINASLDGDNLIIKKDINIGMAAALPSGNLIVPVIKGADQLNLLGITKRVNDLAGRARTNKLKPDEIDGGTYTISNVGTFGNVMGTPIINQPQLAIMAVGAIRKKPVVIETDEGDTIGIRQMMFLSHSYDHRIIDGFLGGSFVRRLGDYLENFDINRSI